MPLIKLKFKTRIEDKPWISRTLTNYIRRRNQLYQVFLYEKSSDAEHKKYKNKLISVLRFEEKKYYNDQLRSKIKYIKGTWSILNKVVNNKNKANFFIFFKGRFI